MKQLTDEQILHLVDTHVGPPCPRYPLDNSDWINFARAVEYAAQPKPFTPDWSQDSAAAESIREHQAICNLLLKEMRHIAGISTGQVKRVAEQALEAVQQAQPERAPLTKDERTLLFTDAIGFGDESWQSVNRSDLDHIVKKVEAAHGIKQGVRHD